MQEKASNKTSVAAFLGKIVTRILSRVMPKAPENEAPTPATVRPAVACPLSPERVSSMKHRGHSLHASRTPPSYKPSAYGRSIAIPCPSSTLPLAHLNATIPEMSFYMYVDYPTLRKGLFAM